MPLRASRRLLLGLCIAAELAFPAMAQQKPPPQDPPAGPPCEAFARDSEGDWVAKCGGDSGRPDLNYPLTAVRGIWREPKL